MLAARKMCMHVPLKSSKWLPTEEDWKILSGVSKGPRALCALNAQLIFGCLRIVTPSE